MGSRPTSVLIPSEYAARRSAESQTQREYAQYWLEEYGTGPDRIRQFTIQPWLDKWVSERANGGKVFDFGCGAGSMVELALSWQPAEYLGIDINDSFLKAAAAPLPQQPLASDYPEVRFVKANFEHPHWSGLIEKGFDVALSIFVLNELNNIVRYLSGIRSLAGAARRRKRPLLALVVNHPFRVIQDIVDSHPEPEKSRKYVAISGYMRSTKGLYRFSRGDFSVPIWHYPIGVIVRAVLQSGWTIQRFDELTYTDEANEKSKGDSEYPKLLCLLLKA